MTNHLVRFWHAQGRQAPLLVVFLTLTEALVAIVKTGIPLWSIPVLYAILGIQIVVVLLFIFMPSRTQEQRWLLRSLADLERGELGTPHGPSFSPNQAGYLSKPLNRAHKRVLENLEDLSKGL